MIRYLLLLITLTASASQPIKYTAKELKALRTMGIPTLPSIPENVSAEFKCRAEKRKHKRTNKNNVIEPRRVFPSFPEIVITYEALK